MLDKETKCYTCEHYKPQNPVHDWSGICLHKEGPLKVFGKTWSLIHDKRYPYPIGCPLNPKPPKPVRIRSKNKPGKKRTKPVQEVSLEPPERKPKKRGW